jgi:hypothetical protein
VLQITAKLKAARARGTDPTMMASRIFVAMPLQHPQPAIIPAWINLSVYGESPPV